MYFPYAFNNIFFSLACFVVRIEFILQITYKIHVNRLFMLLVRLLVNNTLLEVFGESTVNANVQQFGGVRTPTPALRGNCTCRGGKD